MAISDPVIYYLVMPSLLFIGMLTFWLVQSFSLLFISRRFLFPVLYRNKFTEWFVAQVGIAIHELSHFFAALFTGSQINFKESFVTSRTGRISTRSSQSIGGWISIIIAAFAPAFLPGLALSVLTAMLLSIPVPISDLFSADPMSIDFKFFIETITRIVSPLFSGLVSIFFEPSIQGILLLYFIAISSLTSSPSEDDWKASAEVLFSFPIFLLFALFLIINFVAIQFNFNFTLIVLAGASIVSMYVAFGIVLLFCLVIAIEVFSFISSFISRKVRVT